MAGNIITPSLTQIFIKSFNTGIFPTEWKLARVTPIFKKGKRDDLFIPTVAKIFEKIIYDQLCDYLNDNRETNSVTYHFYFLVGKFPKFLNFSDSMEKNYLVELNIFKENAFHGLQKILLDNFPRNCYI